MKRFLVVLFVFCVGTVVFAAGSAQGSGAAPAFPTRPVEIVVPYSSGSGNDINCRTIAPFMEKHLGVPVVISNEPAANGQVAMTRIGKAVRADGYTLSYANIIAITSLHVLGDFMVDPGTEFDYLGVITVDPGTITTGKNSPYKTLADVVNAAKARPGQVTFGGSSLQSLDGLLSLDMERQAGIKFNFVNLGGANVMTAVMGEHVEIAGSSLGECIQQYADDAIEILAIGGDNRAPECPNVPTFKELGYDFTIQAAERALFTRAGTPADALGVLRDSIKKASEEPDYIERCKSIGMPNSYIDADRTLQDVKNFIEFFESIK